MFESALPHSPQKGEWPPQGSGPSAPLSAPGEFTRLFRGDSGGNPIPPAAPEQQSAGEFTRMFRGGTPLSPTVSSAPPVAGGFTQMFGSPGSVATPPLGPSGAGGATQAFSIPQPPAARASGPPPAPILPPGPSEYTRMISLASIGGAATPTAPAGTAQATSGAGAGFQMPAAPQLPPVFQAPPAPQFPQAPQLPQAPQAKPPAKGIAGNPIVIAMLCVAAFIAGILVMLLVKK